MIPTRSSRSMRAGGMTGGAFLKTVRTQASALSDTHTRRVKSTMSGRDLLMLGMDGDAGEWAGSSTGGIRSSASMRRSQAASRMHTARSGRSSVGGGYSTARSMLSARSSGTVHLGGESSAPQPLFERRALPPDVLPLSRRGSAHSGTREMVPATGGAGQGAGAGAGTSGGPSRSSSVSSIVRRRSTKRVLLRDRTAMSLGTLQEGSIMSFGSR